MSAKRIILTGHSYYEQVDNNTIKQLCVTCGGKGFYLLMQGFPNKRDPHAKGEIMFCDQCEDGFKYLRHLKNPYGGG